MNTQNFRGRHRAPGRHNPLTELTTLARESAQPAMKGAAVVAATGGLVASFAGSASAVGLTSTSADVASVSLASAPQAVARVGEAAPAVVGPARSAAPATASALATIGFAAAPAAVAKAPAKPRVIEDIKVKTERKAAADRKTAQAAAARQAAADKITARKAAVKAAAARKAARAAAARNAARAAARQAATTRTTTPKATTSTSSRTARTKASRTLTRRTLTSSTATTKTSATATNTATPGASSGVRASRNWATPGQCTWGVLIKWYAATGFYPGGWTGNAMVWDTGAAAAGYTVSGTPRARSILVMDPGVHGSSSVGHLAWVTSVSGGQVTVIEMNALAGPFNFNTRTLSDGPGMKYIYAP